MARAGSNVTIPASPTRIFDSDTDGGRCRTFLVGCRGSSSNDLLLRIPQLHGDEYVGVPAGTYLELEVDGLCIVNGITDVWVQGDGGDALIDFCVTRQYIGSPS